MNTHDTGEMKEVTIIGAGIVGICCALSLLERGISVRLLDKSDPAEAASYGNAGVISPWSCVPQSVPGLWKSIPRWMLDPEGPVSIRWRYLPRLLPWAFRFLRAGRAKEIPAIADAMEALNRPSVDLYRHHLSGTGHEHLVRDSWYIHIYRSPDGADLDSLRERVQMERGAPVDVLNGDELREVEPALSADYRSAIVIRDQARAVNPGALGKALAQKAVRMGAEIQRNAVHRMNRTADGQWRLETEQGVLEASNIVIAAGPWSLQLLDPLGIRIPLEYERGYHLEFRDPGVKLNNSIMDVEHRFVTSFMEGGVRSAGTAEFAGLDAAPNYNRAKVLKPLTKRMMPGLNTDDTVEWSGVRPSFPDSLPCVSKLAGHNNLFAAFGHGHYGLSMAPKTGQVIADMITDTSPNVDVTPYSADRFQ